jgi:hypothetical protein
METTCPGICCGSPILVHNLGEETQHNLVYGEILRATIENERSGDGNCF